MTFKRTTAAWIVLVISLAAAWQAHVSAKDSLDRIAAYRLWNKGDHIRDLIFGRIKDYEQILIGAKGLFAASKEVNSEEWHTYITSHNIEEDYPGLLAISFFLRVPAADKEAYVGMMRANGAPGFDIWPGGDRAVYFPNTFIASSEGLPDTLLGYDGYRDPIRSAAMDRAMETGRPSLSASATLMVDSGKDHGSGFRMYVPVFRNGMRTGTLEERRTALHGFIGASFRLRDLMAGLSADFDKDIDFRIHDGRAPIPGNFMYSNSPVSEIKPSRYSVVLDMPLNGRIWTLKAVPGPGFLSASELRQPYWVLAAGLFISLLLSGITWSLINTRSRADALAAAMTAELRVRSNQFRELALKAEESARTKSEFLADLSHELRTPLNSVIGFANILQRNKAGNLGEQEVSFLGRIHENGQRLLALINAVLDLYRIEAGRMELNWSEVDLPALVREIAEQSEAEARKRGLELLLELPETAGPIRADAVKLKQAIVNLVENAFRFTERGKVTLRLGIEAASGASSVLEVEDTGSGIPSDRLEGIFEAFRRPGDSSGRNGGMGLGLTLSRSLLRLMGFELGVTSRQGQGSIFAIRFQEKPGTNILPRAMGRSAPARLLTAAEASRLSGTRVLIIDDENDSRILLRSLLEDLGCQVVQAASGPEGLSLARDIRPDLITLDLVMSEMGGLDVVREVKADPALWDVPVVIVSSLANEIREDIHGVVERLAKPVTREGLQSVLRRTLGT